MFTEAPAPTPSQLLEIEKLEQEAKDARQRREESWQRSDTDGFLSQWASGITADLNDRKVSILKNGGCALFPVLCDADGNVIADRIFKFPAFERPWETVEKWRLPNDLAEKHGRKWVPVSRTGKSRIQKQLGLREDARWFPAYAKITTGGRKSTGLSGCANAYVGTFKKGEGDE